MLAKGGIGQRVRALIEQRFFAWAVTVAVAAILAIALLVQGWVVNLATSNTYEIQDRFALSTFDEFELILESMDIELYKSLDTSCDGTSAFETNGPHTLLTLALTPKAGLDTIKFRSSGNRAAIVILDKAMTKPEKVCFYQTGSLVALEGLDLASGETLTISILYEGILRSFDILGFTRSLDRLAFLFASGILISMLIAIGTGVILGRVINDLMEARRKIDSNIEKIDHVEEINAEQDQKLANVETINLGQDQKLQIIAARIDRIKRLVEDQYGPAPSSVAGLDEERRRAELVTTTPMPKAEIDQRLLFETSETSDTASSSKGLWYRLAASAKGADA